MAGAAPPEASSLRLTVEPTHALLDEPVVIRLIGLRSGQVVTIRAARTAHCAGRGRSEATFAADGDGIVDVATQSPAAGSYETVDPMGLFWSMAPEVPGGPLPFRTAEPLVVGLTAVV